MNKLLIICDMFPPAFAPRMGYLCKYLTRMGWEVTVVTEYIEDNTFEFLTGYADVYCVRYYKASGKISKHIEWMWVMFLDILFGYKDMRIINACIPLIKTNQYKGILCSTYRTFPLTAAKTLAIHTNLPFVVDLRDIIEQYASNEYISHKFHTFSWLDAFITKRFRKRLLRKRNNALEVADCVTTVSPWHVEVLKQYNPNVRLIYNGFDPELFYPQQIKTSRKRATARRNTRPYGKNSLAHRAGRASSRGRIISTSGKSRDIGKWIPSSERSGRKLASSSSPSG
jgi:glycosyltransferase involved in cell wall biosynthesis